MTVMVLQNSVSPDAALHTPDSLYFRADNIVKWHVIRQAWLIPQNESICFDSFFNAFSVYKWRKFTHLDNLLFKVRIKGRGIVTIYLSVGGRKDTLVQQELMTGEHDLEIDIQNLKKGRLHFHWRSLENSSIYHFSFSTIYSQNIEKRLAMVITTYNRPKEIKSVVQRIQSQLLSDYYFRSRVTLYIINNGIDISLPEDDNIVYIKNKNLGGAGGFTRGLIEIKNRGSEHFCLFMDDDACCEIESIKRAFAFLRLSNSSKQMIAGAMLYADNPGIVYEAGAAYPYRQLQIKPLKSNLDVTQQSGLTEFDEDNEKPDYAAWWFCAFNVQSVHHYAFPFFVRGDDILFGLMHKPDVITVNGICCWQKDFKSKYSPLVEYLSVRALLLPAFVYPTIMKQFSIAFYVLIKVALLCFSYRYSSAEAVLAAYKHVLKGPKHWGEHPDASQIKSIVNKIASDWIRVPAVNTHESKEKVSESLAKKLLRFFLLNGYVVPERFLTKTNGIVNATEIHPTRQAFMRRGVIYFNTEKNECILRSRSVRRAFCIILKTLWSAIIGLLTYRGTVKKYKAEINYMTSRSYWEKTINSLTKDCNNYD